MTFDSHRRMRIHPRYKMFREKNIEDSFSRTCSNFCFPKIGSQQLKNSFLKKMVSSNNLLQQILVPTSWFVYLKILSATSPSFHRTVPPGDEVTSWPDGGNFFWKKNHGPFCVWIQTTNLYPQNKTKIFWQTFKKKIESLYKNYTFMEKMSKHHHFPKNNFRKTPSFQTPYLGRRILDRHGWRFQALLNEALYCCKRFSR